MKTIGVLFGGSCLQFRGDMAMENILDDPRGLTGSEYGAIRVAQELGAELFTAVSEPTEALGMKVTPIAQAADAHKDVWVAINEPDLLRGVTGGFRVCNFWLNGFTHCKAGFEKHVDLFVSPSPPHLRKVMEDWRDVEVYPDGPRGHYEADPYKWMSILLGCDPERFLLPEHGPKVPGRVVYISSPDRGLHWLLQEWPAIKQAVPHAHLKIFYRLKPWIDGWDDTPYFPPIEPLRRRALYIAEAIRRLEGYDVEVCDSVSRTRIEKELSEAEVLAYPCDTTSWSEGFSCSTLEACAAGAIPVITDCDALGEVYRNSGSVIVPLGDIAKWRAAVIEQLLCRNTEREIKCKAFAKETTWKKHAKKLLDEIHARTSG